MLHTGIKGMLVAMIAIIPAAGGSKDILGRVSNFPASLAIISGQPLISLILDSLLKGGVKEIRIAILEQYLKDFSYATRRFESRASIKFYVVNGHGTPIETIKALSKNLLNTESVILNLGDTYCNYNLEELDQYDLAIALHPVSDNERWATAETDESGIVTKIYEKSFGPPGALGIAGVYFWSSARKFCEALESIKIDSQISHLLNASDSKIQGFMPIQWIDADHQDYLEESRLQMLQTRDFNQLIVNSFMGTLVKKSTNIPKLNREILYYLNIPNELKILYPRMISYVVSETEPMQELEYYSYPTLSDVFVYGSAPKIVWKNVMKKLHRIVFQSFISYGGDKKHNLVEIFVDKCTLRKPQLIANKLFPSAVITDEKISINGIEYMGLEMVLNQARIIFGQEQQTETFMHGDFCLTNILCDLNSTNIKLIDPRGGFESASCFGPQIYDIAKLAHSIVGRYDLILAEQFSICLNEINGSAYTLEIFANENHAMIEEVFFTEFICDKIEKFKVRLISGLILLSIPSFHLDKPDKALAMFLQGIIETNNSLKEWHENLS